MCRKNNVILISDEAYNDLVFEGHWFSMLEFNANHIICCFTFSKSFAATGLRVGYTVSKNPAIISHMVRGEYTQTAGVPTPIQWAFAEALNNKEKREEWFAWYRGEMRKRRDALCETISPEFRPSNPAGAFYTFVDFNSFILEGVDKDYHISKLLMENGIAVVPGSAFGEGYEGFARLSFSTMTPAVIRNGCARLNSLFLK
jgi:aspartate/methionine/tyrosine aminotransferase